MASEKRTPELEATFLALRRVMAVFRGRFASTLREHGLTFPQWMVMKALHRRERLPLRELAGRLDVTPANVTGIVGRLEAAGLVARERSEEDRRIVYVHLSKEGREKMREVIGLAGDSIALLFEGWTEKDLADLRASLERIQLRPEDAQEF